jgi:hypothetical protein
MSFENFSPDSRLWLYQTNRPLAPTEITWAQEQLDVFTAEWTAHGAQLKADAAILNPYFVAIAVDLTQANASGCSIDASVRFLKSMGQELQVDFFNRLKSLVESENGEQRLVPFSEITKYPDEWIYNPLVDTLGKLRTEFKVKVRESRLVR